MKAIVKDLKLGQKELEYGHVVSKKMFGMIGKQIDVDLLCTGIYYGNGCFWDKSWLNFSKKIISTKKLPLKLTKTEAYVPEYSTLCKHCGQVVDNCDTGCHNMIIDGNVIYCDKKHHKHYCFGCGEIFETSKLNYNEQSRINSINNEIEEYEIEILKLKNELVEKTANIIKKIESNIEDIFVLKDKKAEIERVNNNKK